jgi:hypothetical protein
MKGHAVVIGTSDGSARTQIMCSCSMLQVPNAIITQVLVFYFNFHANIFSESLNYEVKHYRNTIINGLTNILPKTFKLLPDFLNVKNISTTWAMDY